MTKNGKSRKENGVVLILILSFMAMFALMIASFLIVTSNMSDTAVNSMMAHQAPEKLSDRASSDINTGIKTLLTGTNNPASPIGPFGILENLYGEEIITYLDSQTGLYETWDPRTFSIFRIYGIYDSKTDQLVKAAAEFIRAPGWDVDNPISELTSGAGDVFTFGNIPNFDGTIDPSNYLTVGASLYNKYLRNSSTRIIRWTTFTNQDRTPRYPINLDGYPDEDNKDLNIDICRFELQLTPELRLFLTEYETLIGHRLMEDEDFDTCWPVRPQNIPANTSLPDYNFWVSARVNLPPFSGTGIGGFNPRKILDGQTSPDGLPFDDEKSTNDFRLPFALWGNASAPDLTPVINYKNPDNPYDRLDFQTYLHYLRNQSYRVFGYDSSMAAVPNFPSDSTIGDWTINADNCDNWRHSIRMNPTYTAADNATLFLGQKKVRGDRETRIPSFVRPETLNGLYNTIAYYQERNANEEVKLNANIDWLSVLRKTIARPLPADHWNFSGGSDLDDRSRSRALSDAEKAQLSNVNPETYYSIVNGERRDNFQSNVMALLNHIANGGSSYLDVDNDNDGTKDGIWIPSGLPIRTDENGTPYATMYSFTVYDMDGRVNINTAGNRDQLRFVDGRDTLEGGKFYSSLETFGRWFYSGERTPLSPWFNVERLDGGFDWVDGNGELMTDISGQRGSGLGPAGVDLEAALNAMKVPVPRTAPTVNPGTVTANLLFNRYLSRDFANLEMNDNGPIATPLADGAGTIFLDNRRYTLPQPGAYVGWQNDRNNLVVDDSDNHRRALLFTDPIYRGSKNDTIADPDLFLFPWRGKTRVTDWTRNYADFPTFPFTDTGLTSYDPLGNDLLTFTPKFTENPYLVDPYKNSLKDSTFSAKSLEVLLRPFDYDRNTLPNDLLSPLLIMSPNEYDRTLQEKETARSLRGDITTISSDIPAPSLVFPIGPGEEDDANFSGVFGISDYLFYLVQLEFYKRNRDTLFTDEFISTKKSAFAAERFGDAAAAIPESALPECRAYLREAIGIELQEKFGAKIALVTNQLLGLLPEEILEGRRLDLNELSHKASWLDAVYDRENVDNDDSTLVRTYNPNDPSGTDAGHLDETKFREVHTALGLVERMRFARGLYVLLMALTYEDRNAKTVAQFFDPDGSLADADSNYEAKYEDYLEGFDSSYIDKLTKEDVGGDDSDLDEIKANQKVELIAQRIAQYCVNLVDFTDPDATMTPFFYDPNPFDGWWVYRDPSNDWMTNPNREESPSGFSTRPVLTTPQINNPNAPEIYDFLALFLYTPDEKADEFKNVVRNDITDTNGNPVKFLDTENDSVKDTYAKAIVSWLSGQALETDGVGKEDFGFRLLWGMERPDLLLTETLSFHDLGIADTRYEMAGGHGELRSGKDEDFDQVRRPLGSSYLELYCAANPNVPQSTELYRFDAARKLWKLDLAKMTPRQGKDSPYYDSENGFGREFPVWRIAISAPSELRGWNEKVKEFTDPNDSSRTYKRKIKKFDNRVVARLLTDFRTFSFRTRQFCDLIPSEKSDDVKLDPKLDSDWRGFDYCVSNLLGPVFTKDKEGDPDYSKEIEIDRIVWFGWPTVPGGGDKKTQDAIDNFPDSAHIYSRVKLTTDDKLETFLFPNQYLVVGPSKTRNLGSIYAGETEGQYFGVPSKMAISLGSLGEETNSAFMLAGTYKGLDINTSDKFEVNKRGFNISEPLWTENEDPYPSITTKDVKIDNETVTVTSPLEDPVPDTPFELPDNKDNRYPIASDYLFGLGTVPCYRSAFVQRVADPNRPYHPVANPYLTVDWNMMDLTVFNGEANDVGYRQTDETFWTDLDTSNVDENNHLNFGEFSNSNFDTDTQGTTSVFSSRCWLNANQKGFFPQDLQTDLRLNPWARAIDFPSLDPDKDVGLEKSASVSLEQSEIDKSVVKIFPTHSLGKFNGSDRVTDMDSLFSESENATELRKLYYGSPAESGSTTKIAPFEHLVWNDAPVASPMEILLVPASAPGRFGLEFIRNKGNKNGNFVEAMSNLYHKDNEGGDEGTTTQTQRFGQSLGSAKNSLSVPFGWYLKPEDSGSDSGTSSVQAFTGPYLNFHNGSKTLGESLNLAKIFDFVSVPSLYNGTKTFAGYDDETDDPVYVSTRREPGKMNINTLREPGWVGMVGDSERNTPFKEEERGFTNNRATDTLGFLPFAPTHTSRLAAPGATISSDSDDNAENPIRFSLLSDRIKKEEDDSSVSTPLLDGNESGFSRNNLYDATTELRKVGGLTTNRSNVFAVWMTVGYFKVERAKPGVNMPLYDPDGNNLSDYVDAKGNLNLPSNYKYYNYYKAIYPDGYTYGKELGTDGIDEGGITRPRAFFLIDRSIPVDFRRGRSWNWDKTILLEREL